MQLMPGAQRAFDHRQNVDASAGPVGEWFRTASADPLGHQQPHHQPGASAISCNDPAGH